MGLFRRSKPKAPEHAVIVHYSLTGDEYGAEDERDAIFALEQRLEDLINAGNLGELDGNEFGGGEAVIYCYGPDAGALFAGIEAELRAFPARPAYAKLRFGDVMDDGAREERVEL